MSSSKPVAGRSVASAVRALPEVAGLGLLWQQRTEDGETNDDYWHFIEWIELGPARGAPAAKHLERAARFEWAERALAYERAAALQMSTDAGKDPHVEITDALLKMVQIETGKLLENAARSREMTVSVKELLAAVAAIREIQLAVVKEQSAKVDLSKLTDEEIARVLQAQEILSRTRGGGR